MATSSEVSRAAADLRVVIGQLIRRLRAEYRFPLSQAAVLGRLDREGPRTTSGLAAAERVTPQSMARTVAELEADGLVGRRADPSDARQRPVELTAAGRVALAEERARRDGWLAQAIARDLTPAEQAVLVGAVALLRRLAQTADHDRPPAATPATARGGPDA
jgi:DNA-binding MarR family transcriptional regulator